MINFHRFSKYSNFNLFWIESHLLWYSSISSFFFLIDSSLKFCLKTSSSVDWDCYWNLNCFYFLDWLDSSFVIHSSWACDSINFFFKSQSWMSILILDLYCSYICLIFILFSSSNTNLLFTKADFYFSASIHCLLKFDWAFTQYSIIWGCQVGSSISLYISSSACYLSHSYIRSVSYTHLTLPTIYSV